MQAIHREVVPCRLSPYDGRLRGLDAQHRPPIRKVQFVIVNEHMRGSHRGIFLWGIFLPKSYSNFNYIRVRGFADQADVRRHPGQADPALEGIVRDRLLARVVAVRRRPAVRTGAVIETEETECFTSESRQETKCSASLVSSCSS